MLSEPYWAYKVPKLFKVAVLEEHNEIAHWMRETRDWGWDLWDAKADVEIYNSFMSELTAVQRERIDWFKETRDIPHLDKSRAKVMSEAVNVEEFRIALLKEWRYT